MSYVSLWRRRQGSMKRQKRTGRPGHEARRMDLKHPHTVILCDIHAILLLDMDKLHCIHTCVSAPPARPSARPASRLWPDAGRHQPMHQHRERRERRRRTRGYRMNDKL